MNYFALPQAAAHYAAGRPDFHALSVARIAARLDVQQPMDRALDVACGTGLSTKALLPLARQVYGTDSAAGMLQEALPHPRIQYAVAAAEQQPFDDGSFPLITVCSGVHWFDIDAFLAEAYRLLRPERWLVVYDNFFLGRIAADPAFSDWYGGSYLQHYPPPPRKDTYDWSDEQLGSRGFQLETEEQYENCVLFDKAQLAQYLVTQSNVIAAVERGSSYESIREWLHNSLQPFFPNETAQVNVYYGNWIKYLKRLS